MIQHVLKTSKFLSTGGYKGNKTRLIGYYFIAIIIFNGVIG